MLPTIHRDELASVTGGIFDRLRYRLFGPGELFGRPIYSWQDEHERVANLLSPNPDWSRR